jgi:hypothetical protein
VKKTIAILYSTALSCSLYTVEALAERQAQNQLARVGSTLLSQSNIEGTWLGSLKVAGLELAIVFEVSRKTDGALTATIDSPDQGTNDIPVDKVMFTDGNLRLEAKGIKGIFDGEMKEDDSTIEGLWTQSGYVVSLVVRRVSEAQINRLLEDKSYAKVFGPDKLKEDLDFLFQTIREVHPNMYAYTSEQEFSGLCDQLYSQINRPMSRLEFYKAVAPVVASLKNGHTYICPLSLRENDKVFPLGLCWGSQDVILQNNYTSNALPLGGTVLAINGKDARKVIKKLARYFPDEYQEANLREVERVDFLWLWLWLEYGEAESLDVQIKAVNGTVKNYVIKAVPLEQAKKNRQYDRKENYTYRYLPEYRTGLIEFNRFADFETFEQFLHDIFNKLKEQQASNLIIDIRENRGGNSRLGDALLDYLTNEPFRQFEKYQVKVSDQLLEIRQNMPQAKAQSGSLVTEEVYFKKPKDNPLCFSGRKFVLTGQTTFSSANCFASAIKCFNIATLIGEETGGTTTSYGDCLYFYLPNSNMRFDVAHKYFVEACGKPDGRGVIPDYEINQKPEDTARGVDTVLQFTLDVIKNAEKY